MDEFTVNGLLRSLGDPGRRQVARILAESALTVGEIADVLGLPQATVSRIQRGDIAMYVDWVRVEKAASE